MAETEHSGGVKLALGGHSYIAELGNDPQATFEEQCALVAACLDTGIRLLDTTYYQERVALGKVLRYLNRRDEAMVSGWNFFMQPGKENDLVAWTPYEPAHIDVMLEELQADRIDLLVIHAEDDPVTLHRGLALAAEWMGAGKVRQVGLGMVGLHHLDQLPDRHPVTHVLAPYNAFNRDAARIFTRARELGVRTVAMSPFIRGWKLDEIGEDTTEVAATLLRWVASQPLVDQVVVSMRKPAWVHANLEAVALGPLSFEETARLEAWVARID